MKFLNHALLAGAVALSLTVSASADDKAAKSDKSDGVKVVRDLSYVAGSTEERQKLDLYLPENGKDFPVLLFLHGGGYSKGERGQVQNFGQELARQGIAVAAAGYRLYPQAKHPEQVRDAARALAWLKANAAKHGGRADALFVGGHSAGGHLAALLATGERHLQEAGLSANDVRGVVSLSGGYRVGKNREDVFGDEASRKEASPLDQVRANLPPFLLAYAEKDNANAQRSAREFNDALQGARVQSELVEAKGRDHGSIFREVAKGDATGDAVVNFIKRNSQGQRGAAQQQQQQGRD